MKNILSLVFAAVFCMSGGVSTASVEHAPPLCIAHRGAPDYAPENTLAAFREAKKQGAHAVECDIHLSADGGLVVLHDDTTGRVWNSDLVVAQSTVSALKALRPNAGFRAAFPRHASQSIPTFAEVVGEQDDTTHIFAELKSEGTAAADALAAEIGRLGIGDRTTVISFSRDTVVYLRDKGLCCGWLVLCGGPSEVLAQDVPEGVALDVNLDALSADAVSKLKERGIPVYAWNAAGRKDYERAHALGVDAVTVNNLSFLQN